VASKLQRAAGLGGFCAGVGRIPWRRSCVCEFARGPRFPYLPAHLAPPAKVAGLFFLARSETRSEVLTGPSDGVFFSSSARNGLEPTRNHQCARGPAPPSNSRPLALRAKAAGPLFVDGSLSGNSRLSAPRRVAGEGSVAIASAPLFGRRPVNCQLSEGRLHED
jgi:hypothetical protein